jgi:hypothetical protein
MIRKSKRGSWNPKTTPSISVPGMKIYGEKISAGFSNKPAEKTICPFPDLL